MELLTGNFGATGSGTFSRHRIMAQQSTGGW
jgi:hypothetical protein